MRHSAAICSVSASFYETVVVAAVEMLWPASHLMLVFMLDTSWCLDPSIMPQRLDIEVSDHVYECLQRLSEQAGLSVRDLVEHLISQSFSSQEVRS